MLSSVFSPVSSWLFQGEEDSSSQHFGVRVCRLVSNKAPVPMVLELMLEHVEMNGLYTEGIYRKSGSANRMKELRQLLEAGKIISITMCFTYCSIYLRYNNEARIFNLKSTVQYCAAPPLISSCFASNDPHI